MFQGHEGDIIRVLYAALVILAGALAGLFVWVIRHGESRLDAKFKEQADRAEARATELAIETRANAQKLDESAKSTAALLAAEAQSREDELGEFKERMWGALEGLRAAIHETSKQVGVSNATISGTINTLSTSVDLRINGIERLLTNSLAALEKKLPNGQMERLANSYESITKRLDTIESKVK